MPLPEDAGARGCGTPARTLSLSLATLSLSATLSASPSAPKQNFSHLLDLLRGGTGTRRRTPSPCPFSATSIGGMENNSSAGEGEECPHLRRNPRYSYEEKTGGAEPRASRKENPAPPTRCADEPRTRTGGGIQRCAGEPQSQPGGELLLESGMTGNAAEPQSRAGDGAKGVRTSRHHRLHLLLVAFSPPRTSAISIGGMENNSLGR